MKKVLLYGGIAVVALALVGYVTMQFFLGSIVKAGVNKFGPGITQTKVELNAANISPLSGVGTLSGFTVGNPQGWSATNAFSLGKVHIDLEPFSIFDDHIVINEIVIEQPEFLYETKIVASNIGDLLKNIERSLGGGTAPEPKTDSGQPVKMVIKKLVLREGKVTLSVGGTAMTMPMPPVDMADIGVAQGGATPAQVAVAVMRHVTPTIVAAATAALAKGGGATGTAVDTAKQAAEAIKGLFGGQKK
jgi:uncharacterized protein involved in outer membrane biogenesis